MNERTISPSDRLRTLFTRNRAGERVGVCSVCCAHPLVIRAALELARDRGQVAVIESTCNQVNQDGGYTGLTPQQFADGFADTAHVVVTLGDPTGEDAGAGQRYIQVPVAITATRKDGSVHRYDGSYTLHRTVVDGATDEQRAWRIASADLRELQP